MAGEQELPITGICIVSDPSKCPPNYTLIDKTQDRPEDADLWSVGLFQRRVMRYLCIQRQIPSQNQDVLVDVTLIVEKDLPPAGFTVIDLTHDTREKATQKRNLCVRWMIPSMTKDAITDLIFVTKAQRRPPTGYTLVGELNNISLCYKMGPVPKQAAAAPATQTAPTPALQGYPALMQPYNVAPLGSALPYAIAPIRPMRPAPVSHPTLTRMGPPEQSANSLATGHISPISGIEWKMNPKYRTLIELNNVTVPDIMDKTMLEIERDYAYDFSVERSVSKSSRLS